MNLKASILTIFTLLLFAGCTNQKSPEEVAQSFWTAVIANDAKGIQANVMQNSLPNPSLLSNKDKTLSRVEFGPVTTHNAKAEVVTTLIGNRDGEEVRLPITTYLSQEEKDWKVNGQESVNALVATSMNLMMNDMTSSLSQLGDELSRSISSGVQEFVSTFTKEAPAIKEELSRLTDEEKTRDIGQQLGALFSDGLRKAMKDINVGLDELSKEIEEASKSAENPSQNQ